MGGRDRELMQLVWVYVAIQLDDGAEPTELAGADTLAEFWEILATERGC